MQIFGSIHVNASETTPREHVVHDDGRISIALGPISDATSVYLVGTLAELSDVVDKLGRVVLERMRAERWGELDRGEVATHAVAGFTS